MLRYITSSELDSVGGETITVGDGGQQLLLPGPPPPVNHSRLVTQIVVAETDVSHSGTYGCEPGDAPPAKVKVHVIDGNNNMRLFLYHIVVYVANIQALTLFYVTNEETKGRRGSMKRGSPSFFFWCWLGEVSACISHWTA